MDGEFLFSLDDELDVSTDASSGFTWHIPLIHGVFVFKKPGETFRQDYRQSPQFPEEVARSGYKNRKERAEECVWEITLMRS